VLRRFLSRDTELLRGSEIRDLLKLTEGKKVISFAGGLPDPSTFPVEDIRKIADNILSEDSSWALQYSATPGIYGFRKELVRFSSLRGISNITPENIMVTVGSQEALYIIFNLLVDPGDIVIVEKPTYLAALNILRTRRPKFYGIPQTENGMDLDILEDTIKRINADNEKVKLLYTVPTAQNPAGTTLSLDARKRIIELANKYDFLIIEDDAYGFLTFEGESPPAIKALDKESRVIYTSTFSKILAPGFRLGWVIADHEFITEMEMLKQNIGLHTPTFTQAIAMEALRKGVIESHLPKIKSLYKQKRDIMLENIEKFFPKGSKWSRPTGGMFIFAWLDQKINATKMLEKALARGVAYVPGESFYHDFSGKNTMRINFSLPKPGEIVEGIKILAEVIREELN
jgi:2-aminoadipate transaminase